MGWKFNPAVSQAPCPPVPRGAKGVCSGVRRRGGSRSSPSRVPWLLRFPRTQSPGWNKSVVVSGEPRGQPLLQSCYLSRALTGAPCSPCPHRQNAALWLLLQLLEIALILREFISHLASIRGIPSHFQPCSPILPGVPAYSSQEVQANSCKFRCTQRLGRDGSEWSSSAGARHTVCLKGAATLFCLVLCRRIL